MVIRQTLADPIGAAAIIAAQRLQVLLGRAAFCICLLYTSDAADERSSVDLGGRRIIKKKIQVLSDEQRLLYTKT